jgi:hypothetical protein
MVIRQMPKDRGGMRRQFVDALPQDNPTLLVNDPTYLDRVRGQADKAMVGGWLHGDSSIVSGAMYADSWNPHTQHLRQFPGAGHMADLQSSRRWLQCACQRALAGLGQG